MAGGVPCGAVGATRALMDRIADHTYEQVGTSHGNPLTLAAVHAMLTEALTEDADRFVRSFERFAAAAETALTAAAA